MGLIIGAAATVLTAPRTIAQAAALRTGLLTTQRDLFASLPHPKAHDWTRIILGQGAKYQKQIGVGTEIAPDGSSLRYYEIQVGSPGGSCNPNSLRKAYLRGNEFGSLLDTYPLLANIGRSENLVFRYGDASEGKAEAKADSELQLLDLKSLYDERPLRIVSISRQRIHVASHDVETTYVVGEYPAARPSAGKLRRIELWHAPEFPFGVARYTATLSPGEAPYELSVYAKGTNYKTDLPLSLAHVRAITKDGAYGPLPGGLGT